MRLTALLFILAGGSARAEVPNQTDASPGIDAPGVPSIDETAPTATPESAGTGGSGTTLVTSGGGCATIPGHSTEGSWLAALALVAALHRRRTRPGGLLECARTEDDAASARDSG